MLDLLRFFKNYSEFIIFGVIFVVVLFFFLREFKLTSKNSWGVLLGLTALGGFLALQAWKRKKLLQELEARERALEKLEESYKDLKDKQKLTEEAFNHAKNDLERAKVDAGLAILKADEEHAQKAAEIEREFENKSADDLIKDIRDILNPN
ncbi:MAG: hypothetical protein ACE5HI_17125 [bacterium]